ncbi:YtxH domain-containing protein [Sporosarcina sp. Te-1]|uniref:YtxH domain-containing protein n=1 Tax=Sporosarcina sp. Te-1 TaxID=2818390 RepID=UPI001A9E9EE0|nr:YtxH domain-containing protein [Sporosarcina sp. Te-1]QTD42833.1 YtxH domain-containing protein [Sporosarcina sp. Te-1]
MKASTFVLGIIAGSAAAAVTVLYSTPQSGKELRSSVKSASSDLKYKLQDVKVKLADMKHSVKHLANEAKEYIPQTVDGVKESIEKWQMSTASNQVRLEKEILAIQNSLEELEKSIAAQNR